MSHRLLASVLVFSVSMTAWGQGGRGRGAAAGQPAPPAAANPAGALEFFNFDPTAGAGQPVAEAAPAESHQKITLNGQAFAYTAHAGHLPLRNATTGQSEAHLFYTWYAKDGADSTRPIVFFFGGAPGVSAALQEFGGLGPRRIAPGAASAENPHTLLAQADLVFVNPVGAGLSHRHRVPARNRHRRGGQDGLR